MFCTFMDMAFNGQHVTFFLIFLNNTFFNIICVNLQFTWMKTHHRPKKKYVKGH